MVLAYVKRRSCQGKSNDARVDLENDVSMAMMG